MLHEERQVYQHAGLTDAGINMLFRDGGDVGVEGVDLHLVLQTSHHHVIEEPTSFFVEVSLVRHEPSQERQSITFFDTPLHIDVIIPTSN